MGELLQSVPALLLIGAVLIPLAVFLVLGTGERILEALGPRAGRWARPWLWLSIPLLLIGIVLVYPIVQTVISSFMDASGARFVGGTNFVWAFGTEMQSVLVNNAIWLIVFPIVTVLLALIAAVLFDRVRYEKFAMTIIVLPTAISFTAASVIWRQIYETQPAGTQQTGLLNALWTLIPGAQPVYWLQAPFLNTLCLIFVAVWSSLGVASLILSAAVKNVPADIVEAAQLDGASAGRVFFSITLPTIAPTLLVVITTEVIFALKVFDIIYVMTAGNFSTSTIANQLYYELFSAQNLGHASAIALILLIVALPIALINIRQFRRERSH